MQFGDANLDDPIPGLLTIVPPPDLPSGPSDRQVKRPHNAYNLFFIENQHSAREQNPSLSGNEISHLLGRQWSEMDDDARRPYKEQAKAISAKFRQENPDYHYQKASTRWQRPPNRPPKFASASPFDCGDLTSEADIESHLGKLFQFLGSQAVAHFFCSEREVLDDYRAWMKNCSAGMANLPDELVDLAALQQ
jgi:hypothetical protein